MTLVRIEYEALGDEEQIDALRPVALAAAAAFGLEVARLEPLLHSYNTTFELEAVDGRRLALRVGTNSKTTIEQATAQQEWMAAIGAETDVLVPEPLRTAAGQPWVEVEASPLGRPLLVTAASWLEGEDADELRPEAARALGRAMATLHEHAADWEAPPGGVLPSFSEPLFGDDDLLARAPLAEDERDVLAEARRRVDDAFARVATGAVLRPLHADLHGGNLKWHGGRLAVFDFDDAGLGAPVLDLAISTFYLRGEDPALERALREGYAEVARLPEHDVTQFEALVAGRQLLLANAMLSMSTAELRAQAADYAVTSIARLRRWLETGAFTRAVH